MASVMVYLYRKLSRHADSHPTRPALSSQIPLKKGDIAIQERYLEIATCRMKSVLIPFLVVDLRTCRVSRAAWRACRFRSPSWSEQIATQIRIDHWSRLIEEVMRLNSHPNVNLWDTKIPSIFYMSKRWRYVYLRSSIYYISLNKVCSPIVLSIQFFI